MNGHRRSGTAPGRQSEDEASISGNAKNKDQKQLDLLEIRSWPLEDEARGAEPTDEVQRLLDAVEAVDVGEEDDLAATVDATKAGEEPSDTDSDTKADESTTFSVSSMNGAPNVASRALSRTSDRQYSCQLCDSSFLRSEHLKRHHDTIHAKARPFRCTTCGQMFSRKDNRDHHQRTKHK